ncbi:protein ILRUN [Nasonia vitripennis]|uniref:Nbr1 FW domain-containing protein n=1 Tax=Nasonia vitripennis TaxID=7425 RepID=A0A7M7QB99_NASVI|nr:protein ILRUN [Nasonia vitripennis]
MDVDELDQHLLQQFSCLGTTDKDDLVKQMQKVLVGNQLNEAAAAFLLDMNNWNLQAAICSYFDFETTRNLPMMTLICDSTIGEGESVPPNTKFRKSWHVQNSGAEPWPEGIFLNYTGGAQMGECTRVPVPCLPPRQTVELGVDLTSPSDTGVFQSKWRMMTSNGSYFGDIIWVIITVSESGTLAVTQQLHQLSTSQSNDEQMW